LLDNFDSFTYNLVDYFDQLNVMCRVIRNNQPLKKITAYNYRGIVLSPGPGLPGNSGNLLEVLNHYHQKLPILGICLGHQAIGEFFDAEITRAIRPMHGKISKVKVRQDYIFQGLPDEISVVRYHSLVLDRLPRVLETIGLTSNNEIMAIRHKMLNIRGLQFHPEAILTEFGMDMLRNWVKFNAI